MLTFIATARAFLKRIPWQVWCGIAVVALLWWTYNAGYNTARDKGRAELAQTVATFEAAQAEAERLHLAAKAATEARYRELAGRIDNDHARNQAAASSATARFIAANRVQPCPVAGATSGTIAAPGDHGAGVSASVPADSLVALSDLDVRACTAAATYAIDAYKWANSLGE
jgi:hypothetical protein